MSGVYLSRLKLRGFRSYTSETEITFPAGPGMTVIVGPNGLGKSTLFDAIEWGLTGELRRISGMDAKESDKRAALGRDPNVQLWFSDNTHISRGLFDSSIANAEAVSIADWLTADAWRGMSNIADCLQFTHLLGQSSRQMFVHLDGKERWDLLEGPAGLQSLWKVERALGRNQTQLAFDRVEQELAQSVLRASENIETVRKLHADLQAMRELARAGDALAPEEILDRCSRIREEMDIVLGCNSVAEHEVASANVQEIDALLQRQKKELELAEKMLASQRAQLRPWESLAEQYVVTLAKRADLAPARDAAAAELIRDEVDATEVEKHVAVRKDELGATIGQCADLQKQRDAALAESERLRQLVVLDDRRQKFEASLQTLASLANEQERAASTNREALAQLELRRNRHTEAVERRAILAQLAVQVEALLKENSARQGAYIELASLPQSEDRLLAELEALRLALVAQEMEASALRSRKEAAIAVSNSIAAGVAQIAAALREDDCVCPVCRSTFAATGKLKDLAEHQANESNEQLAALETEILRQDEAIRSRQQELDAATGRLKCLRENRTSLNASIAAADQLESHLRSHAVLAGLTLDAFLPALSVAAAQTNEEIGNLTSALTSGLDEAGLRAEIQRLTTQRSETVTEQDKCSAALAALADEVGLLRSWSYTGKTADELRSMVAGLDLALVESQQAADFARSALQVAQAMATVATERVEAKRLLLAQIDSQRELLDGAVNDLTSRWSENGYEHAPLPDAVRSLDADYESKQLRLNRIEQEHETLVQGRRHYLAHSELQRLDRDMEAKCSEHQAKNVDALFELLIRKRDDAVQQQGLLATVQDKRKQLVVRIKQKASNIRSSVSAPLNANIEKFCAALMSDRNHQVSLNAIANATSAQALLSFQPEGGSQTARNPLLYMSEGQLAAISLCLLFGASATYPWSRWKGLLLDDPLHHNDSVHAAAFIDVARNLIKHQHYQIIVSTHDMDQAGYFLRKCSNAGIQARYWHLYGRSEDGTALIQSA